jgi:PKD repeat protein
MLVFLTAILSACLATPSPVSSVDYNPKTGIAPLIVSFSVNASDPRIHVIWDFGDGATGSGIRINHTYTESGEYSAEARLTLPGGRSENRSGLLVTVHDPQNLPGNYTMGNLSSADMLYLSTLQKKIDLFDQYYIEFIYLNKSHATAMRYTSRDFQFTMRQSLTQLESIETSPELDQVRNSAQILFTNATDGAYAEFLAGINLEKGDAGKAESYLEQARPKMEIARGERDRLVKLLDVFP